MARFGLCLCLLLTLWMDGSRWSVALAPGTPGTGFEWGSRQSRELGQRAAQLRRSGDYSGAEALYQQQLALAAQNRDEIAAIRSLLSIGAARELQGHDKDALTPLLDARQRAQALGDRLDLGVADFNLSNLYLQMWDLDSATSVAEEGVAAAGSLNQAYYRHQALLQLGRLREMRGDPHAAELFQKGIEAARAIGDASTEAIGWDLLGEQWLRHQQFADAERALTEAFRIRAFRDRRDLPLSYARLGELKLDQGNLSSAQSLTRLASRSAASKFPDYLLTHQEGSIQFARGDVSGAIQSFRAAAEQAVAWGGERLPASAMLIASNSQLETRIFDSFVETAAHQAVRKKDSKLAQESFLALEWNRAESLRESVGLAPVWREKLPARYWNTLDQLHRPSADRVDLNLKLTEMEAEAGLRFHQNHSENFRTQTSLISLQQGLSNSDLLLSFHLGKEESYVWALTRNSLNLYALGPSARIRRKIEEFRDATRDGKSAQNSFAEDLYQELAGSLSKVESARPNWLLSLDGPLFEAPLAALRVKGHYLVELHSLTVLPGAMWLAGTHQPPKGWFLGVGDPIYNTADPRWQAQRPRFTGWFAQAAGDSVLNRLVASGPELQSSERSWNGHAVLLSGTDARREKFLQLAAQAPAVIHLATHVLSFPSRPDQAGIAFGLEPSGTAGFLSAADVAMMSVPGAVITMTGCETGGGTETAGAGLIGLTRAWQIAGARAVVSTLWPVRDSAGDLFSGFYRHLHTLSPAEALRQSQVEMIHSGTWRAEPRYWSAYQVTGGELAQ